MQVVLAGIKTWISDIFLGWSGENSWKKSFFLDMFEWFWSLIGNKLLFLVNFFNLD
jgi:hypothetical protein